MVVVVGSRYRFGERSKHKDLEHPVNGQSMREEKIRSGQG